MPNFKFVDRGLCLRFFAVVERLGLTQQEVADHLGVSRRTVSRWQSALRAADARIADCKAKHAGMPLQAGTLHALIGRPSAGPSAEQVRAMIEYEKSYFPNAG